jgi:hypothetical protein
MPCNASYARFIFGKVFHKYYNLICTSICTKILFLEKVGVTSASYVSDGASNDADDTERVEV